VRGPDRSRTCTTPALDRRPLPVGIQGLTCAAKGSNLPPRSKSPVLSHSASSALSHPPVSNRTPPTYRVGAQPDELGRRGANERPRTASLLHGKQVLVLMSFIRIGQRQCRNQGSNLGFTRRAGYSRLDGPSSTSGESRCPPRIRTSTIRSQSAASCQLDERAMVERRRVELRRRSLQVTTVHRHASRWLVRSPPRT
jgi:hypothetical protein